MGLNEYYCLKTQKKKKTRFNCKKLGCCLNLFGCSFLDANNMVLSDNNGYLNNYFDVVWDFRFVKSLLNPYLKTW